MPKPFVQGLADRKMFESWRKLAPSGLCAGRGGPNRKEWVSACQDVQELLAEFDRRRRADTVYRADWNSLLP
jgi:hypothetical protein